jgi:hypothetical protein
VVFFVCELALVVSRVLEGKRTTPIPVWRDFPLGLALVRLRRINLGGNLAFSLAHWHLGAARVTL